MTAEDTRYMAVTGLNLANTTHDPTAHSEVTAIRNACQAWATLDLSGATLYTSFEPCPMCCGAILVSGLTRVFIGARPAAGEALGDYQMGRLLDLTGRRADFDIRTDVLADEAGRFYASASADAS